MSYDKANHKQDYRGPGERSDFGLSSRTEALKSDTNDIVPYPKAIIVTVAGTLTILPVGNADGKSVAFGSVPVGFIPPFQVRRVFATGTTASVATID